MNTIQTKPPLDTWISATWEEYITAAENVELEKTKSYYHDGEFRIEMTPVGPDHAYDNGIIVILINLFSIKKNLPTKLLLNCSYRKTGIRECQPDISYYIGQNVQLAPQGSSVVDIDNNSPPDLVIEIANTSVTDDLGEKRLLYEEIGIKEYWVVNVSKAQIIAFQMLNDRGSQRINQSQILPELDISLIETALKRSRQQDNTQVASWFISQI
jgi:Uma2 family endonuclease